MASLDDVITQFSSANKTLGLLVKAFQTVFPQQTGTATTATGGAATLPGNPVGFVVVSLPDGTSAKIPYYR